LAAFPQFQKALDIYKRKAKSVAPGEFIPLNKLKQWGATNVGTFDTQYGKDLAEAKAAMVEIAMQGSRVFAGTAMQEKPFEEELKRLGLANPYSRIERVADLLKRLAKERETALRGGQINMPRVEGLQGGGVPAANDDPLGLLGP
jgi:hypothetical protein